MARGRHAPARDQLQPRLHDARPAGGHERPRGARQARGGPARPARPGYREILARELPHFVRESVALVFGKKFAEAAARRCLRAAAAVWADVRVPEEIVEPTCLFAMLYLRYLADDSDSWDETKEHESLTTREEELIRETSSGAFARALRGAPRGPLDRPPDARRRRGGAAPPPRARAHDRGEAGVRRPEDRGVAAHAAGPARRAGLRRAWAPLRELGKDDLTLRAIEQMVALEKLRGGRGA